MTSEDYTMMRTIIGTVLALLAFMPRVAQAQTEQVFYYHLDAIGSVRVITDASNQVVEHHDYLPFGDEWVPPQSSTEKRLFAGKERDQATGLDYFGARDYVPSIGRFGSPDPVSANELRIVNPQRWNRYTYAVNSPLTYGDPDGLDVIVFNFVTGASGAGHIGIMAVDPNTGSGVYGGFNPSTANMPYWKGRVAVEDFADGSVAYADGRPTRESMAEIKDRVASRENQGREVRSLYFKTSAAETEKLRQFIIRTAKTPPRYNVAGNNCEAFCILGLRTAGIPAPDPNQLLRAMPNVYFALTLSELAWHLASAPVPKVETSYCFQTEKGCAP